MSKKIGIIPIVIALFLMTACSSSKVEAPVKIDEQTNSNQPIETATNESEPIDSNDSNLSDQGIEAADQTANTSTDSTDSESSAGSSESQEPYIFPDFSLEKLDGSTVQLYDFKDKIIVINFWATWCHYCEQEMPLIEKLSQNDKYQVLAIDVGEDSETIKKYLEEQGISLDVYLDQDQSLASQFSVTGFPTSVFLGPNFEYLYAYPGMLDQKTLDSILTSIDDYLAH